jgi:hypothetical protein
MKVAVVMWMMTYLETSGNIPYMQGTQKAAGGGRVRGWYGFGSTTSLFRRVGYMSTVHCLGSLRLETALKAGSRGRLGLSHITITLLHHAKELRATISAVALIDNACRHFKVHSLQIA